MPKMAKWLVSSEPDKGNALPVPVKLLASGAFTIGLTIRLSEEIHRPWTVEKILTIIALSHLIAFEGLQLRRHVNAA